MQRPQRVERRTLAQIAALGRRGLPGLDAKLLRELLQPLRRGQFGVHGKGGLLRGRKSAARVHLLAAAIQNVRLGDQRRQILREALRRLLRLRLVTQVQPAARGQNLVEVLQLAQSLRRIG